MDSLGAEVGCRPEEVEQLRIAALVVENTVALLVQGRICLTVGALPVEHCMVTVLEELLGQVDHMTGLGIRQSASTGLQLKMTAGQLVGKSVAVHLRVVRSFEGEQDPLAVGAVVLVLLLHHMQALVEAWRDSAGLGKEM